MNLTAHHRVNQYLHPHPVDSWLDICIFDGWCNFQEEVVTLLNSARKINSWLLGMDIAMRFSPPNRPNPFIHSISRIGSQHDGDPPGVFITFQRDLDKAGHGHREDHPKGSQNPSPEDQ